MKFSISENTECIYMDDAITIDSNHVICEHYELQLYLINLHIMQKLCNIEKDYEVKKTTKQY